MQKFISNCILLIFSSCIVLITMVLPSYSQSFADSLVHFRNNKFGDKPAEVIQKESAVYMQDFKGFGIYSKSYKGKFADLNVRIDYTFRDNKLTEASYNINDTENIISDFKILLKQLTSQYGRPHYYSNHKISSPDIWIKESDYGAFKGPELYWQFANGFIALIASKFRDVESLTVLYAVNKDISKYGTEMIEMP